MRSSEPRGRSREKGTEKHMNRGIRKQERWIVVDGEKE